MLAYMFGNISKGKQTDSNPDPPGTWGTGKRIGLWGAMAGVLIAAGLAYYYFWQSLPVGKGPAGPAVPREGFRQAWSQRPVLLVGMGDSVTAGFGASEKHSYFDRLVANPADEFSEIRGICLSAVLPHLKFTNLAMSGSTSLDHLRRQVPKLRTADSNTMGIVVLTTGGNDIIHNYGQTPPREGAMYGASFKQAEGWITNFDQRLETIVGAIKGRFPGGCHIFLANIYDPTDGIGDLERAGMPRWSEAGPILNAYQRIIQRCAERHSFVHLVNLHDEFLGHGIHCTQFWRAHYHRADPHYWYYFNVEDPNDRGYDAIRRLFLIEMGKVTKEFE